MFGLMPSSLAIWLADTSLDRTISTASRLNSAEYFLRFGMTHLLGYYYPIWMCP
jgi:hypothetical protein